MKLYPFFLLALASLVCSCNRPNPSASIDYATQPVTEAIPFAEGIISTPDNSEFQIMFSPDGKTAYFSRRAPEEKQKIYETTFVGGTWTTPRVASFSTDRDETPFITPDGKFFFFGSERPIPGKPNLGNFDMNIWLMEKTATGWTEPRPLPAPINDVQQAGEEWPSSNSNFIYSVDNNLFYFTTMRRGTQTIEVYQSTFDGQQFAEPERIEGLFADDKYWKYSAVISPDGKYMIFNSFGAPGGAGGEDIFVSQKTPTGWSEAKPIGPKVNSANEESGPRFSRDGKYFFYNRAVKMSNDEYGEWSIYFIETQYLNLEQLFL